MLFENVYLRQKKFIGEILSFVRLKSFKLRVMVSHRLNITSGMFEL